MVSTENDISYCKSGSSTLCKCLQNHVMCIEVWLGEILVHDLGTKQLLQSLAKFT